MPLFTVNTPDGRKETSRHLTLALRAARFGATNHKLPDTSCGAMRQRVYVSQSRHIPEGWYTIITLVGAKNSPPLKGRARAGIEHRFIAREVHNTRWVSVGRVEQAGLGRFLKPE